jgi:hypothetical protein
MPYVVGALVAIKAILLAIDPTIRVYLGDSAAYLYGARDDGRLPDDRSFTYSFFIRALVRPFEQLSALAQWQSLAGVIVALLLWRVLERHFAMPRRWAFAAACVLALEPAQLFYERMVLAETFGLLAFVMFFAASAAYLALRRAWWLPVAAMLGLIAVTLRLNYLPVVLVISVALPLLPLLGRVRVPRRSTYAHAAVAILAVTAVHHGYRYWVGYLFETPPAYLGRTGFMQLGLLMPLVKPEHLARVGLPPDLETQLRFPIADPDARMRHLWSPGGFVPELRQRHLDVEYIARQLSRLAIADDPMGIVRLGLHTFADYFRKDQIASALDNDLGRLPIHPDFIWSLREHWGYHADDLATRATAVSRYFELGTWWLVACLLMLIPVAVLNVAVHWNGDYRLQALLAGLFGIGLVLTHLLFVPVAFYRYLHPLPFFVFVNLLPLAAAVRRRRAARLPRPGCRAPAGLAAAILKKSKTARPTLNTSV